MGSIHRECDKNMKKLYTFMNRNKKPLQETFGLKNKEMNWVTDEEEIKTQLKQQWDKIYESGCWPNSNIDSIETKLRPDEFDIHKMEMNIERHEVYRALDQLHASTSTGTTDIPPEFLKNLGDRGRNPCIHGSIKFGRKEIPRHKMIYSIQPSYTKKEERIHLTTAGHCQ